MTDTNTTNPATQTNLSPVAKFLRATELDTRLLGMFGALALIWLGFHYYGVIFNDFGAFLTARNLWNLSVQTSSIGIMATGMVLVIITRNIDLSVGALVGVTGMTMGILQVDILPQYLGLGNPFIWIITVIFGITVGATIGAFHGWLIAYRGIPAFIVTLGGLLVWRGSAFLANGGKTISPVDSTFQLLGGGPYGAVGETGSWIVGIIACLGILWLTVAGRRNRVQHDFKLRPMWAEVFVSGAAMAMVIGAVLLVNSYPWPIGIVKQYTAANGITTDPATLVISHGFAIPVLILAGVGIMMTILMTKTRFGRYVFAIGGNPEAAALAGINVKWMTMRIFALMGALAGLAGVVASARLNSATNALGVLDELYVIAAAVIGGVSLSGGKGTIPGVFLGAILLGLIRNSLNILRVPSFYQYVMLGAVIIIAVTLSNLGATKKNR